MKKIFLVLWLICLPLTCIASDDALSQSLPNVKRLPIEEPRSDFMDATRRLRRLIDEQKAQGEDVSQALELQRKSRDAMRQGNRKEALRLLNEAMHTLRKKEADKVIDGQRSQELGEQNKTRRIELPISADKVLITRSVPNYASGKEISDYESAFQSIPVEVKKGKVSLELTSVPIFVEEEGIQPDAFQPQESPFGIHGIRGWNSSVEELGVQWIRYAGQQGVVWDLVEPEKGRFDWSRYDRLFQGTFKNNVEMLITVKSFNSWDQGLKREKKSKKRKRRKLGMPNDLKAYSNFLQKMVERYDRDGKDDAVGAPIIKYWQIQNEVDGSWGDTPQVYAVLVKTAYKAIKNADASAQIVLAGVMSRDGFRKFYIPLLECLNKIKDKPEDKYFDVFDFHWGGEAGSYKRKNRHGVEVDLKNYIEEIQATLKKYDFSVPIWITEISTYSGHPESPPNLQEQSEETQASELVKLYVYPLAQGVKKIFWVSLKEWGHFGGRKKGYFKKVGLISNPRNDGDSHKKLAYYSYRMLAEKLEGVDLDKTQAINIGKDIYCLKFIKRDKFIYVLWHDSN